MRNHIPATFRRILGFTLSALFLPTAQAVDIQRWHTPEGTQVLLVSRHENPIVDIQIDFKGAGSAVSGKDGSEVAEFTAALLTDGTHKLDEEAFNARINELAVEVASGTGGESAYIRLRSLSNRQNLQPAVQLVNQALTQPRFAPEVFKRRQRQSITALKQNETDAGFIAGRAVTLLNYPDHPYGASAKTNEAGIAKVGLGDIRNFHRSRYGKNNAVVAVVGDLNRHQAEILVKKVLNGLPDKAAATTAVPAVPPHQAWQQNIPFAGEQAQIALSLPLITRDDPDYYALIVGNYILGGGGFDSRLMKVLRDQHGYTYGASSSLSPAAQAGPLTIGFSTKKASTNEALAAARKVVAEFIKQGPTEEELQQAKDNLIGGFPLRFDTNAKLLGYLSVIGVYDLPENWLDNYPKEVASLTAADIRSVWQRRVKPEDFNVVVVGAEK
ncbi:M16 family metallopeptidase [Neisseria arctica]|uniref:M16 family metallopeptidase n=1 Tax=Neisseria arctica TaxID=1470200 RepID=UPI00064B75FB|nr:pitrilysin family protein [Neisseria arctica]UOO86661.1 insulinase family protein [Neisseria arctica]